MKNVFLKIVTGEMYNHVNTFYFIYGKYKLSGSISAQ